MTMRIAIASAFLLSAPPADAAEDVYRCAASPEVVAPCFTIRGRLSFWNGAPSVLSRKFATYCAGPRRPWLRCASSEYCPIFLVGAPCQGRRLLAEIGSEFPGQNTSARIWPVGTKRLLGIRHDVLPPSLRAEIASFDTELFADFRVCPFTKSEPGHMQFVCIESWRNPTARQRPQ